MSLTPSEPPLPGQTLRTNISFTATSGQPVTEVQGVVTTEISAAQVSTSLVAGSENLTPGGRHKVLLDIDLPCQLIPSSTPGHFHLYIDQEMDWDEYQKLLTVLAYVGIVEPGYASASVTHGFSALRLPWIRKPNPNPNPAPY